MKAEKTESNVLSEERIRAYIANKDLQNLKIFTYDMTDSTNTRAREYYRSENPALPAVFIADGQTAGRGRRGRSFDSRRGAGIYISFLLDGELCESPTLTAECAVKCARAIETATGLRAGIKWVNDLFASGKKLAGILAEGERDAGTGRQKYAVVGIGINLLKRDFPKELSDIAISIEECTGEPPDRLRLLGALICEMLSSEYSRAELMKQYRGRSTVIGKNVAARRISGGEFECTVLGITDSGTLLVRHEDGRCEELISAEISISHK